MSLWDWLTGQAEMPEGGYNDLPPADYVNPSGLDYSHTLTRQFNGNHSDPSTTGGGREQRTLPRALSELDRAAQVVLVSQRKPGWIDRIVHHDKVQTLVQRADGKFEWLWVDVDGD